MFGRNKISSGIAVDILGLMQSGTALSQEAEEIIVTAAKRAESIQEIPMSIQAVFRGEQSDRWQTGGGERDAREMHTGLQRGGSRWI